MHHLHEDLRGRHSSVVGQALQIAAAFLPASTRGGGTTRGSWGEKSWAGKTRKKQLETSPVCHGDASMLKMQSNSSNANGCQSKFENQQLAPKFSETMIINPSSQSLPHPLLGTLHKLPPEFPLLPSHCILSRSRFISSQVLQMFPCNLGRLKKRRTGHVHRVYTTQHTLRYTKYY